MTSRQLKPIEDAIDEIYSAIEDYRSHTIDEFELREELLLCLVTIPDNVQESSGLDSRYSSLVSREWGALANMTTVVLQEAANNAHKRPKMTTLLEEVSELYLSLCGKHADPAMLELSQVSSVAINLMWQLLLYGDQAINNVVINRKEKP